MAELPALRHRLGALTQARVLLGRAGQSMPTRALLDFQLDHARARDAVQTSLDVAALGAAIGRPLTVVRSQARDRTDYLRRPDLGRLLHQNDAALIPETRDMLAIVIADGLSATAVQAHAAPLIAALVARLPDWTIAPLVVGLRARVALGDDIGEALGADLSVVLIGERPGLSAHDSLGAYLTWAPHRGRRDSERNCVSNIRPPHGLSYAAAADTIVALLRAARHQQLTGVGLKEGAVSLPRPDHA
ncbi:MAG: ethanolamine ammonia-lyase subunit EutC [Sphingomonas sp.]